jgi:3-methylfumaryl-CoA hydratase
MADGQVSAAEIEEYRAYVGRSMSETDMVGAQVAAIMAATLDRPHSGSELAAMAHYGLFLTSMPTSKLGADGHARRGEFMPPVRLPRRMFAGSDIKFLRPLKIAQAATRTSRIASVEHRRGKSGDLVFVSVSMSTSQADKVCLEEDQTIVYRGAGAPTPPVVAAPRAPLAPGETSQDWTPTSIELFRYSAAIFNAHRIHFDFPYVTKEEGYPGLIVTGPLTATRLCDFAAKLAGRGVARFRFRGEAPLFVDQPIRLVGRMNAAECAVRAERADGVVAMSATAYF